MRSSLRILLAMAAGACLIGIDGAGATEASSTASRLAEAVEARDADPRLAPRVQVGTPWGKDDTVGDATRPQGDLRRIIVENGRQQMTFTFRTVAIPFWDTAATDRTTGMVFDMDWHGTTPPPNRTLVIFRNDGPWFAVILNGGGQSVCSRQGGVRQLTNNRFVLNAPVQQCLGGAHILRVGAGFVDDADDTAVDDTTVDRVPNSGGYGPFIRLPGESRSTGDAAAGWTVH